MFFEIFFTLFSAPVNGSWGISVVIPLDARILRSRTQFRPLPVSIVTVDHLSVYHSRNRFFYKPTSRITGEISDAGGVHTRKQAVEAAQCCVKVI